MFSFGSSSKRGGGSSNKSEDTNPAKTSNNNVLSKKSSFLSASSAGASAQSSGNGSATGNTSHQTNIQSTFRKKPIPVGQKGIELQAHINSTLGNNGSLRDAVKLPKGEDELEWIAVNVVDFFNALVFLYDVVNTEHCTEKTCPTMCAGPKFEYRWMDGEEITKPMECSAPVYCGYLFRWVEKQIDDEKIFPKKQGDAFPREPSLMRAGKSLGGTPLVSFVKIYFPLTIPGIGAGSLLVFILAIGYYITPALVGGASGSLISNNIAYHMKSSLDWAFASALGTMLLVGVLAIYWVYNKLVGIDNIKLG